MAEKDNRKKKDEILNRSADEKGRDVYKKEGAGIPGRETF